MGTRNLICIRVNKKWVVAQYCQYDGYPEGQGLIAFRFLKNADIVRFRERLANVYEPSDEVFKLIAVANKNGRDRLKAAVGERELPWIMHDPLNEIFPSMRRDIGALILQFIADSDAENKVPVYLDLEFANDSVSCEWAYVIDLDDETFKILGGSGSKSKEGDDNPFQEIGPDDALIPKLVTTFTFSHIKEITDVQFIEEAQAGIDRLAVQREVLVREAAET
ncbi:hypothetical protein M426DRAFT_325712 [Hypoxylon sp. CI-4A]|nr:hypothetical protein M426DRAFT_325712 [Hypoxylon sp. CI-4A]